MGDGGKAQGTGRKEVDGGEYIIIPERDSVMSNPDTNRENCFYVTQNNDSEWETLIQLPLQSAGTTDQDTDRET